jgi:hypothetical protein
MKRPFVRATMCGSASKRCKTTPPTCGHADGEHRCRLPKGKGTDHVGSGKCLFHGGATPNGRRQAGVEAAENALATLEIPSSTDPVASLFEAVRVSAWRELGLRQMLQRRPGLFGLNHQDDQRPDVVAVMHADALEQKAKIAAMAISAGLDERIVRLAERQGEVIHRILTAALDAADVKGEPRRRAEEAVIRELVAVSPGADERN